MASSTVETSSIHSIQPLSLNFTRLYTKPHASNVVLHLGRVPTQTKPPAIGQFALNLTTVHTKPQASNVRLLFASASTSIETETPKPIYASVQMYASSASMSVQTAYASKTTRLVCSEHPLVWQQAYSSHPTAHDTWQSAASLLVHQSDHWQVATPSSNAIHAPLDHLNKYHHLTALPWLYNESLLSIYCSQPIKQLDFQQKRHRLKWQDAQANAASPLQRLIWIDLYPLPINMNLPWSQSKHVSKKNQVQWNKAILFRHLWQAIWQETKHALSGQEQSKKPPVLPVFYQGLTKLDFLCAYRITNAQSVLLNFTHHPCGITQEQTVFVPVKKVYIMVNDVELKRINGQEHSLPALSMSLSVDVDSWTWHFSASLPYTALDRLKPSSNGLIEVEAKINDNRYQAIIENISIDRAFGQSNLSISGRGISAVLDTPYAPDMTFHNGTPRTALQLMQDALTFNGVSLDWTLDWQASDWLIPANVWTHQGSYMSAINAIAASAGSYIQSHPTKQILRVLPRYPELPWEWSKLRPDFDLPSAITSKETIERQNKAVYNRVFVSGVNAGVLGQITRAGTAGDLIAPMVTDALITTAAAARQRAVPILSDTGQQEHLSLRLPVLSQTGIIEPGRFVRYQDGLDKRIGLVRSTSIEANLPNVWQTLGIEIHV